MVCDHTNVILLRHPLFALWQTGRLELPLFSFALAYNLLRSADVADYTKKLLLFAAGSQPIYYSAFHHHDGNILFTLAAAAVVASALIRRHIILQHLAFAICVAMTFCLWSAARSGVDYGLVGMLFPALLLTIMASSVTLVVWFPFLLVGLNLYRPLNPIFAVESLRTASIIVAGGAAILLLAAALRGRPRFLPRNALYFFYPVHLLALLALRALG